MKNLSSNGIRKEFLKFFEERGHKIFPSDSLVPSNDPTLLFTGAGMNQFKDYFLGKGRSTDVVRAASCQRCLRTADLDQVGKTSYHHTFFEMLGNFSFGDYFKEEAIEWAWEFLTKCLDIPEERLCVSVYEKDEEAYHIWKDRMKIPPERIFKFGEEDNFWPANAPSKGPNGPCGPCSEILYIIDAKLPLEKNNLVELWNIVFTQFDRQGDGTLSPLPRKNIDTGMGLERLATVLQGVSDNFEIDTFSKITSAIKESLHLPVSYTEAKKEVRKDSGEWYNGMIPIGCHEINPGAIISHYRKIADHIRAITFLLADGVYPTNTGRGYVLKKLIRSALIQAIFLKATEPVLFKLVPSVICVMSDFEDYAFLKEREGVIKDILQMEEDKFFNLFHRGRKRLISIAEKLKKEGGNILSGKDAFRLYDENGIPPVYLSELTGGLIQGYNEKEFLEEMEKQKERARQFSNLVDEIFVDSPLLEAQSALQLGEEQFVGYEKLECPMKILFLIKDKEPVEEVGEGDDFQLISDKTCFYGEKGGQVGDTGVIYAEGTEAVVSDTKSFNNLIVHHCQMKKGKLRVGQSVIGKVDFLRRLNIERNHTATHLLQAALREVLGSHIQQSGSLVAPDRLRFDFTHFRPLSSEEISNVEKIVNEKIVEDWKVVTEKKSFAEAKEEGVLAFFGEKYGHTVRVVTIIKSGEKESEFFSKELCGGTHLPSTGLIGCFKIISEGSIASGIRRIEAVTSMKAIEYFNNEHKILDELVKKLGTEPQHLPNKIEKLLDDIKRKDKQIENYQRDRLKDTVKKLDIEIWSGIGKSYRYFGQKCIGYSEKQLRNFIDDLKKEGSVDICLLLNESIDLQKGVSVFLYLSPGVLEKCEQLSASDVLKRILTEPPFCGSAGGRRDFAQGGFKYRPDFREEFLPILASKLKEVLRSYNLIQ